MTGEGEGADVQQVREMQSLGQRRKMEPTVHLTGGLFLEETILLLHIQHLCCLMAPFVLWAEL